jgi:hypothetical protein
MTSGNSARLVVAGLAFAGAVAAAPASAHTGVFIGGAFGYPYGGYYAPYYPYPAYPYYPPYPYYPYPAYQYGSPPPGYEPGHWEWRQDASGRSIRVWVPQYLR